MIHSLRANLTLRMASVLLGAFVVLGAILYWRAHSTVADLADTIISQTSDVIENRVVSLVERAERTGQLVAGLQSAEGRVDASERLMRELIASNPELGSISYTVSSTGEHVRVVQLSNGQVRIQRSLLDAGGQRRVEELVPFGDSLRVVSSRRTWDEDLRMAGWYQQAEKSLKPYWTDTYLIRQSSAADTPGVTYAVPVFDKQNVFRGVVTVDFTTSDLSRFAQTIQIGASGYPAVLEFNRQGDIRVVAHPQQTRLVISDGPKQRLATLEELADKPLRSLVDDIVNDPETIQQRKTWRKMVMVGGARFQAGYRLLSGDNRPRWLLVEIVPESDFMGSVWETATVMVAAGGLVLMGVVGTIFLVARRVAQPLQELAQETVRIRALDLGPRPLQPSRVREIDELAGSMEQMKAGLRSLEKLVPADYARWLIATGQEARLGGERRRVTVYFADIIGFTALSERMEPEELVDVLAEYLDVLSGEVLRMGGTVDKFNGDDVMAFWGAPNPAVDHALLACRSALNSHDKLLQLHHELKVAGKPMLMASFGIATGDVVVGNVGSRQRMNYTVIGDSVNLASRLQGLNKHYRTHMLLNAEAVQAIDDALATRLVDWVSVLGRDEPEPVYELLGPKTEETVALSETHNAAMKLYRSKEWRQALVLFHQIAANRPHDGPARILAERCESYMESPPPDDWDGTTQMHNK